MGKATMLDEQLKDRILSGAERAEREAAAKSGGITEATTKGQLVVRSPAAEAEVILQAPDQTWD